MIDPEVKILKELKEYNILSVTWEPNCRHSDSIRIDCGCGYTPTVYMIDRDGENVEVQNVWDAQALEQAGF